MKKVLSAILMGTAICAIFVLFAADKPARDVSAMRHPNLAEAQRLIDQAFIKITDAQKANEFDMQGHAQKAKNLLDMASSELKLAANLANEHKKGHRQDRQADQ